MFKKILQQQETLFYSIVVHDSVNKKCLSIADFITNSNTNVSIYTYLYSIIEKFKSYTFFKLPKAVVTDFSWANINAILKAVNNLDVIDYLNLSFQIIVKKQIFAISGIKSMIYLCSTHLMKNIQDDTKKALKYVDDDLSKKIYNLFINSFCILQNSICLDVFNLILKCIKVVFTTKTNSEEFLKYYATLKAYLINNTIEFVNHTCINCKITKVKDSESQKNEKKYIFIENVDVSYTKDSPFTRYFDELNTPINESEDLRKNKYYMPKLFDIVRKRLHIMPLWSGVMFKHFGINQSRLSNNYVEKWFQDMKINILNRNKRVNKFQKLVPSDLITPHYFNLKYEFTRLYEDAFNIKYADFESKRTSYQIDRYSYEKWSLPRKSKESFFNPINNLENIESAQIRDLIKNIKLVDIGLYENMEIDSETDSISDCQAEDYHASKDKLDQEMEIEVLENFCFNDVYEKETNIDNFFYFKITDILLRKKDISRLLNNEWLSERVNKFKI